MINDTQHYYDQSEMVLKTDHDILYVLPNFKLVHPVSDEAETLYFQQYQQAYDYLRAKSANRDVTVIKYKPLWHQPAKTPAWLQGSRAADSGGIKRSKPMGAQQNRSEAIGFAKRQANADHSRESLAKQAVGRKIIVQPTAKPASNTKTKSTDVRPLPKTQSPLAGALTKDIQEKSNDACSKLKVDMPMSPVWEMGWASRGDKKHLDQMQEAIDYLTCKGKNKLVFSNDEKEFLKEIYEALWWGGKIGGASEAATLADHYVNGDGDRLKVKSEVYESSVIVKDTMKAMEQYITAELKAKRKVVSVKSGDASLTRQHYYKKLMQKSGSRDYKTEGYILDKGALLTEQNNQRLKNADNRFYLQATVVNASESSVSVKYSVESKYDFEPFSKDYYTNIPIAEGMVLKLPDGLSNYMVKLGIAAEFDYYSEWGRTWDISK